MTSEDSTTGSTRVAKGSMPSPEMRKKTESIETARLFEISLGPFKVILIITICDALIDLRAFYERAAIDG